MVHVNLYMKAACAAQAASWHKGRSGTCIICCLYEDVASPTVSPGHLGTRKTHPSVSLAANSLLPISKVYVYVLNLT